MTIAEKIFARHWVLDAAKERSAFPAVKPGDQGFVRTDIRFSHEYVTPMAAIFFEELVGKDEPVNDPESVFFFRDHLTFLSQVMRPEHVEMGLLDVANQLEAKQRIFAGEKGIKLYGELNRLNLHGALSATGSEAICHSKILEAHAEPGQIIIGSDSHTPHAGAVGCIAFGVGTTAIFNSWITKDVRVEVPPTLPRDAARQEAAQRDREGLHARDPAPSRTSRAARRSARSSSTRATRCSRSRWTSARR